MSATLVAKEQLTAALSEVLIDCAPETNRKGWMARLADDIRRSESSVRAWCYGEYPPEPEVLLTLFAHLGPTFANKVLVLAGLVSARVGDAELILSANSIKDLRKLAPVLRAAADEIDEHAGKLRPKEVA